MLSYVSRTVSRPVTRSSRSTGEDATTSSRVSRSSAVRWAWTSAPSPLESMNVTAVRSATTAPSPGRISEVSVDSSGPEEMKSTSPTSRQPR